MAWCAHADGPVVRWCVVNVPELRTPAEWSALDGVTVMDPDGWRGSRTLPAKSWNEPIDRGEWEQRLSVSTQSLSTTQPEAESLSVVDRVALRLMRVQIYGTQSEQRWNEAVHRRWGNLNSDERENYRQEACGLLADIALGDNDEMQAWPEYQVRHPEGAVQGGYDDVSDAVHFLESVWPTGEVRRRTYVTVRSEWTEVTA